MKLSEYLENDNITCNGDLSKENWGPLIDSIPEFHEKIEEYGPKNIEITFRLNIFYDTCLRSPSETGHKYFWFNGKTKLYETLVVDIFKIYTAGESRKHGGASGIGISLEIPNELWFTVQRIRVQNRVEYQCPCCGKR